MDQREQELFDHIRRVDEQVRRDYKQRRTTMRFGMDYLAVGWLNTQQYCEYKFENEHREEGVPVAEYLMSLPPSRERDNALQGLTHTDEVKDDGIRAHQQITTALAARGKRPEVNVSAPYLNTVLLGRMDLPELSNGTCRITDWKTGNGPLNNDPFNGDTVQILGYCHVLRYILDQHTEFRTTPIVGTLHYTKNRKTFSIDFDSRESVVRRGFTQFRMWTDYTPGGLVREKLERLWLYYIGKQEAIPPAEKNRVSKCRHGSCEFGAGCRHSPYRIP